MKRRSKLYFFPCGIQNSCPEKGCGIRTIFLWGILVLCLMNQIVLPPSASSEETYTFDSMWPALQKPWHFNQPSGIAVDNNGVVYVVQRDQLIQKFTADGMFIKSWGIGNNPVKLPYIAVDNYGYIYVFGSSFPCYSCIEKYDPSGQKVLEWDTNSLEIGGIAIDNSGDVYVLYVWESRISKFNSNGTFIAKWGSEGSGDGQFGFRDPDGDALFGRIATDTNNNIYILDPGNSRIQKFTSDGEFLAKWGKKGSGSGDFDFSHFFTESNFNPSGDIAVDRNGNVYVSEIGNSRVQKFTSDGEFIAKWGNYGVGDGEFIQSFAIAAANNGNVYVADFYKNCVQEFSSDGQFLASWENGGSGDGEFYSPLGLAIEENGYVFVADVFNHRIQKFNNSGQFLSKWGSYGRGNGQFDCPYGVATDESGNVYVADYNNSRIQKFTSDGQYITQWGEYGDGNGEFFTPSGIVVDGSGYVYVADTVLYRIQKFTSVGQFVSKWGHQGSSDGEFSAPYGIAVDDKGYVYVCDMGNNRIQKFTLTGQFVSKWGDQGSSDGEFNQPSGITIGDGDFVYVADSVNRRIQKFTLDGQFVAKFGSYGTDPGMLQYPYFLVAGSGGRVFVSDTTSNRISIFKEGTSSNLFIEKGIIVAGGGPFPGNNLWDATEMCANLAYRSLINQGFTKETIYYLSSDTDLDLDNNGEADDVDSDATKAELYTAISNWASDADDLIIYMVDHGGNGSFRMSEEELLLATELDTWLDTLQENVSNKVVIAYDACESGSFLSALMPPIGKERIVITSTSPEESAYFISQGSISFSAFFWTHIFSGISVYDAFTLAKEAITYTTDYQTPLLDDNGNGVGNEGEDGVLAGGTYIGSGTKFQGEAPVIASVSPDQTISGTNSALIYADNVTDSDNIVRVWAVFRPPDYSQETSFNPIQELPSLDLMPKETGRYENTYDGFNSLGTYQIAIYARDEFFNTSIPVLTTVSVESPLSKKAVIVAGGEESNSLWEAINNTTQLVYEILRFQGYPDDDISFLSPAITVSGVDGIPTQTNLDYVINTWAYYGTQDLVICLVGNGDDGIFTLSGTEILSGSTLDSWLDNLQDAIPGKITVIHDACRSGSFIPVLCPPAGSERILISSTGSNESACFLDEGNLSFSAYFWPQVLNGADVYKAFTHAAGAISVLSQGQTPQLDDNGNGVANEKADGQKARDYTIGVGIMLAGDEPLIGSVCPEQTLSASLSAVIWADDVTTTGTIDRVLAVITPPGYSAGQPSDPVTDLPIIELSPVGGGRYEAVYAGFTTEGAYDVAVYAMDTDGNTSLPKATTVTQTEETSISPTSASFDSSGGTGSVSVTASSGYSWTATSNSSWITITSGASGLGNGTVNYSVSSNTSESPRTGTMTIAGNTFTVDQSGASESGLWSGATDLGYGWKYLDWFGSFWVDEASPWIYHNQHGWTYAYGDETSSIWFYTTDMVWFWTSDTVYPWIYIVNSASWGVWN